MGKHQIFSIFILRQFPYKMSFMRFLKPIWPKSYGFYSNKDQKEAKLRFVSCFSLCLVYSNRFIVALTVSEINGSLKDYSNILIFFKSDFDIF